MRAIVLGVVVVVMLVAPVVCFAQAAYLPALMHSTVLNGVKIDPRTGDFHLYHIQAVFLPEAKSEKSIYPYNPDSGGKLWAILTSQADGTQLARYDFYGELLKQPYWLLGSYKLTDLRTNEEITIDRFKLPPGDYILDFFLESGRFYTFPFSVSVVKSTDPFAGGEAYFLDGAWNNWGYFYYPDADPNHNIQWKIWLRHKGTEISKDVKIRIGIMRESENNKLIATNRPNMTFGLRPGWNRFEFDLIEPMQGTSGGRQLQAKDILAVDGTYILKMVIDDQTYGIWRFRVLGGKFVLAGQAVRGEADPLTFVEGGRDAFWYARAE